MTLKWLTRVGIVATACSCALVGCSDDPATPTGVAGTTNGGSGAGTPAGGSTTVAGSATTAGTSTTAGTAGMTGVAGKGGSGGSSTGGNAGSAGSASAGSGGTAGSSVGGEGGAGGEGGSGGEETLLFDFETDIQTWEASNVDVVLSSDATQFVTGAKALKAVVPALAIDANRTIAVRNVELWPGTKVELHVWSPAGTDTLWVQAYSQSDNWKTWDTAGGTATALVRGGWTTLKYTVPNTFPGGLQLLGVQVGAGTSAFAGGDFYIDTVTASGGVEICSTGTGTGAYGFETAAIEPWEMDPNSETQTDTTLVQSTTQAKAGTGSLKVAFAALAAGTGPSPTARRVFAYAPTAYCTDEVTLNVWSPAGSEAVTFQAFTQSDNYATWDAAAIPATITRDGWTELKVTVPATVGPGGLQRVGVQFLNSDVAYTGDFYIDGVSW